MQAPPSEITAAWLAFLTPIALAVLALTNWFTARRNVLLLKVAKATHTLVNSQHGLALLKVVSTTKRLADLTKDPVDIEESEKARKMFADHEAKQGVVDAG